MKKTFPQLYVLFFTLFMFSCGVFRDREYKNVSYYQNLNHSGFNEEGIKNYSPLKIQPGDILGINVNSINQEAASVFNTSISHINGNNIDNTLANPVFGFKVDPNGVVQLPLVGETKVAGLTTDEVAKQLDSSLLPFLKSPIVNVRLLNFKISVLGDVVKPDVYTVQNEHININEALSLAGDLNITANRTNILLVREENGSRQFFHIDLRKKELFDSPYYYLHNNDILYIDPDKTKYDIVSRSYKKASLTLSALSVLAIVLSGFLVYHH
ncbi:polysaccharide biosynthesis/export family protein [Mucilaginibacter sp.]